MLGLGAGCAWERPGGLLGNLASRQRFLLLTTRPRTTYSCTDRRSGCGRVRWGAMLCASFLGGEGRVFTPTTRTSGEAIAYDSRDHAAPKALALLRSLCLLTPKARR